MRTRISKLAAIALIILCAEALGAQQPASALLPTRDEYSDFVALIRTLRDRKQGAADPVADQGDIDLFEALLAAGREDGVALLARAYKEIAPDLKYCYNSEFRNPVALAYKAKRLDLAKRLLDLDPGLANMEDFSPQSTGPVPFAACVEAGDLETLRYFVSKGADLKAGEAVRVKGEAMFASNLLTISPSARMGEYLTKHGVPTTLAFPSPRATRCLDDKVRMRKEPNTDSAILAVLAKGEALLALGYGYAAATIGGVTSRWISVERKGQRGWVFGAFVETDF
jgi:hypothetical protein